MKEKLTYRASGKEQSAKDGNVGTGKTEFAGGITTDEYLGHLAYNSINSGILSAYNMARYDMSWSDASTTTGFYSGMNYSVSELGGFAGSALAEATGRADVGRQKDKEAREKAEKEAAKQSGTQKSSSSGEGFVNALWMGFRKIKDDVEKLWNGLTGEGFNTNEELRQMEEGKKQAIAAAMGEYSKTKSKDMTDQIVADFWKDSKEVTEAKRQVMKDAGLDTTELDQKLVSMRQLDAELKAQAKAELLAQQSAGKDTQTQYIAQFGAVYSNNLGNQSPKSASFLDNLLGNAYADEGRGDYVRYNVGGDSLEFAGNTAYQGSMLGDMYGYNQSLISPVLWNTAADRAAYDKAQLAEQNDFKDKYQFAMMNDKYSDKDFGQATIGQWDGINRSPVIKPGNGITNRAFYEMGSAFGLDPTYDRDLIQATINGCQVGGMAPVGRALTNGLKAMVNSGVTSAINAAEGMLGGSKTGLNTAFNVLKNPAVSGRIADGAFGAMTNEICYLGSTPSDQWTIGGSARSMIIGGATGLLLNPYSNSNAYGLSNSRPKAFGAGFAGGVTSEFTNEFIAGGTGSNNVSDFINKGLENVNAISVLYSGLNYGLSTGTSYSLASEYKPGMAPYMKTSFIGNSWRVPGSVFYGIVSSKVEDFYIFRKKGRHETNN